MGRKRKNTKVSLEGKKRKIEPDVTDKRKLSQDVNKENGRKRKNTEVSIKGKKRKFDPDVTDKRKLNQDVNEKMGKKRKNTKVSLEGKKRKIEPDVTDKRKLSQDVNKENYVGTFQWAKLQGLKVMWPVLVKSIANDKMLVYVKSDDDMIYISKNKSYIQPFPGNFECLKNDGIAYLQSKKLWSTLECFKADIDWATTEDTFKNGEGSSNCYTDKEYVTETPDSTRTKNAKGEKSDKYNDGDPRNNTSVEVQYVPESTRTKHSEGEKRDKNNKDDHSGNSSVEKGHAPKLSESKSTEHPKGDKGEEFHDGDPSSNSSVEEYALELSSGTSTEHSEGDKSEIYIYVDPSGNSSVEGVYVPEFSGSISPQQSEGEKNEKYSDGVPNGNSSEDSECVQELPESISTEHSEGDKSEIYINVDPSGNSSVEEVYVPELPEPEQSEGDKSEKNNDRVSSGNSSVDGECVPELPESINPEQPEGDKSDNNNDGVPRGISADNSEGEKSEKYSDGLPSINCRVEEEYVPELSESISPEYSEREKIEKYSDGVPRGNSSAEEEYVPETTDSTKTEHSKGGKSDMYNNADHSGNCSVEEEHFLELSESICPEQSEGEKNDGCNESDRSSDCSIDKQCIPETLDHTRTEDTEWGETESTYADENYCSDDSSADKDYAPDSCDNSSDGEESDEYPMLGDGTTSVIKMHNTPDKEESDALSFKSSQNILLSETDFVRETSRQSFNFQSVDDDDDDDDDDVVKSEEEILRDKSKPDIYIMRVLTSETTKTGMKKKRGRVYNSYQYCGSCKIKVSNLSQHLSRNQGIHHPHRMVPEIKAIQEETNEKERNRLQSLLRYKYNHEFNMRTIGRGKGEILLERRPVSEFHLNDYGPCPNCLTWVAKKLLRKHQKSCVAKKEITQSIGDLTTQSECLSGQLKTEASKKLLKEVFAKMLPDEVAATVKKDVLIVQLGNQWIEKNVGNALKRGVYTSQILRLVGRFLLNLRKVTGLKDASLWDYLKPKYFQSLVQASLLTACPLMDDEDNLKSPSNAIKLGYDIRRLINGKIGISIIEHNSESQHDGEQMLKLMDIYWGTRVTKLARVLLEERHYCADKTLPLPEDIASLNKHLSDSIANLDLTCTSTANFKQVAELIQAKLVIYNRRRTGELQAIRICDYARRCKGGDGVHLLGKCSDFEKKLLESQEVMTVRGKVGRPVPVILPHETKLGLAYLTDSNIRQAARVADTNEYVFASGECSIVWAYDSIKKVCLSANLKAPSRITSTNMRKYMATVTQVLDLTKHQMQWVLNHLGHTMNVHQIHYRATSDLLERTQISKLLLLQDQDRIGEFKNKCLNDIQLEDVVFDEKVTPDHSSTSGITETDLMESDTGLTSPNLVIEALDEAEAFFPDSEEQSNQKFRKRPSQPVKKIYWSKEEEEEINKLFKSFFDTKTRPKPSHCVKAIQKSKRNSGLIWKRKKDTLKKKVFRMIDKL